MPHCYSVTPSPGLSLRRQVAGLPSACRHLSLSLSVGLSLGLVACGGSNSGDELAALTESVVTHTSAETATLPSDAAAALDTLLAAADGAAIRWSETAVAVFRAPNRMPGRAQADAVGTGSEVTVPLTLPCPASGTFTISANGTAVSLANMNPDVGETYRFSFDACSGFGKGALSGSATVLWAQVEDSSSGSVETRLRGGEWDISNLTVAPSAIQPGQTTTLALVGHGGFTRSISSDSSSSGAQVTNTHLSVSTLSVLANRGTAMMFSTLSAADLTRSLTEQAGVFQSSSLSGSYTLTLPGKSMAISGSTSGSLSYDSAGLPQAGQWSVVTPGMTIGLSLAAGSLNLTVDKGSDGSVDKSFTGVPLSRLLAAIQTS